MKRSCANVNLPELITVQELANRMAERVADVVKSLMTNGMMATQNQSIDADTAELIIEEFGHKVVRVSDADVEDVIRLRRTRRKTCRSPARHHRYGPRRPRQNVAVGRDPQTNVVSGEAGGITQHIGAYQVDRVAA